MDKTQLIAFCDYATGFRAVGVAGDQAVETPYSPELRAFIAARLGDNTPGNGWWMITYREKQSVAAECAKAFAALLREVADGLDPPTEAA